MSNEEKTVCDIAADKIMMQVPECRDKLQKEKATGIAAAKKAMKLMLVEEIGKMIAKFCYQNEDFAAAVEKCDKELSAVVDEIINGVDQSKPSLSDVEAYMKAVKAYLPEAEVICSFRINIHKEFDDDLLDLESFAAPQTGGAIILDLFGTGEE